MGWLTNHKIALFTVGLSSLLFIGLWIYWNDLNRVSLILSALCVGIILINLLIYQMYWYYLLVIAFIPLSLDAALVGTAKLNLPSEGMLFLAIFVLLIFNAPYRRGLVLAVRHPITQLLFVILLVELFSTILSTHVDVSLKRFGIQLLFIMGFFGITQAINDSKRLLSTFFAYAVGLVPVMYFTLVNHAQFHFMPQVVFSICQPYYNDHTVYGASLAFVIPLLLIVIFQRRVIPMLPWQRMALTIITLVIIVSELLALSRAALISLVVVALFYGLLYYRLTFKWLVMGLLLLGMSIWTFSDDLYEKVAKNEAVSNDGELIHHFSSISNVKNDASNLERINRWICAYRMFEDHPWLGFGLGTYQFEYNRYQTVENKTYISTNAGDRGNAHSEYFAALSETGILGFIGLILLFFGSIYYGMQNHYRLTDPFLKRLNLGMLLGLVSYYFHGIFNSFLDQSKMAFLVYGALGIIVWINLQMRNGDEKTVQENS